ncbi:hypothetical protein [Myroides profundi]|uniref:Uncharacterized protein n=1 Tax=Myroides profundi TaxID=480520 RepID=A0AAJ4W6N6_MYRPR|nr:hypothetical protein [Myroides profundi]AJH15619.1 hypothetical protein MPR_2450 [Myroides profundi]SER53875.1 hypothetical protein SAMN04488089_11857 [Myroides profundi]
MKDNYKIYRSVLLILFLFIKVSVLAQMTNSSGVKIRPTSSTSNRSVSGSEYISPEERANAYDTKETTFTQVKSTTLVGSVSPILTLIHSELIDGSKNVYYIKLTSSESESLNYLLGGYVGNFLTKVLQGLLLGGIHETTFTVSQGNNVVFAVGLHNYKESDEAKVRFVKDAYGNYYARVTAGASFDRIAIQDKTAGILGSHFVNIYDSFYYSVLPSCPEILTNYKSSNDVLTLLGESRPIKNEQNAIDNDLASFASVGSSNLLNLGIDSQIEQFFYLPEETNKKVVRIKMQLPSGLLKANVASGVEVLFYSNNTVVSTVKVNQNVLKADVLGIINAGGNTPFSFLASPGKDANGNLVKYDKISIKVKKPISVGVLTINGDLQIYDVALVDAVAKTVKMCSKEFVIAGIRQRKFDLTHLIPDYNENNEYVIVNQQQKEILFKTQADKDANKWQPLGTYYIKGIQTSEYCPNRYASFNVQDQKEFSIQGKSSISVKLDSDGNGVADASVFFNAALYESNLPNNSGVQIFDELTNANVTGQTISFDKIGTYNYYAISKNAIADSNVTCDIVKRITVYVYDKQECEYRYKQKMATHVTKGSILTGAVLDESKAIDQDLSTFSTISNLVNLAGIGTAWVDLTFDNVVNTPIVAGTPITIKLGQQFSLLELIGGTTIQALDKNGAVIGPLISIGELDLVNVLAGDNVFEYTFIPKDNMGNMINYGGVRVLNGGLLGVATSARVYGAYIDERILVSSSEVCESNISINGATAHLLLNKTTKDVLYGVEDAGIGVATSLSGVLNPYYAVDAIENNTNLNGTPNYDTAAVFNTSASVLNRQKLVVKFKDLARPGDKVQIIMSAEGGVVLDLNLLSNFSIQRYMGSKPIGEEVHSNAFEIIRLDLLKLISNQAKDKYAITLEGIGATFDRIEIRMDNVVSVNLLGVKTYVWDVSVLPTLTMHLGNNNLCITAPLEIEKLDPCTTYNLSFAYAILSPTVNPDTGQFDIIGWNDIPNSLLYQINNTQDKQQFELKKTYSKYSKVDNLYLKIDTKRQGCSFGNTQYLKVIVKNCGTIVNPLIRTRLE